MHPSIRILSERVHKPLINFLGKRTWPSQPGTPHAHPAAPADIKKSFSDFSAKFAASSKEAASSPQNQGGKNVEVYQEFWEAPARFWRSKVRYMEDAEIEAVLSGGASLR